MASKHFNASCFVLGTAGGRRVICLPCQIAVPPPVFSSELSRDRGPSPSSVLSSPHPFWPYRYKKAALSPQFAAAFWVGKEGPKEGRREGTARPSVRPSVRCSAKIGQIPDQTFMSWIWLRYVSTDHGYACSMVPPSFILLGSHRS